MNKIKKCSFTFYILCFLILLSGTGYADHYATTDMTYAEFYAGELGLTAEALLEGGLDAISTATTHFNISNLPQIVATSSDERGNVLSGVRDIQVFMSDSVYDFLTEEQKQRYTFVDEVFDEYKEVSADGSFGAMVTEESEVEANVTVNSGGSSAWGHYTIEVTSVDYGMSECLGATVETSDGKIYALRHINNLYRHAGEIAFVIDDTYVEPHGAIRYYEHTADIAGKTITKITYILKDQPNLVVNCSAFLPTISEASVKPAGGIVDPGTDVPITLIFKDVPSDSNYQISSVTKRQGRQSIAVDYDYTAPVLTIAGEISDGEIYRAIFKDSAGKYADLLAAINVSSEGTRYATTDMTYAEFYAGELGSTAEALLEDGLDAISTATDHFPGSRFTQLVTSLDEEGCNILLGVKDVQVAMSKSVYDALTDDEKNENGRYKFTASKFDEYKVLDASGNFGKLSSDVAEVDAAVAVTSGVSSTWGHYTLAVTNASVDAIQIADYLGAVIETSDGKTYGLRHLNNLWVRASALAFVIDDSYVEPHGAIRYYEHTEDLAGKTITKITYILKNQPNLVVNCSAFLPMISTAAAAPTHYGTMYGTNQEIPIVFTDVPDGANYDSVAAMSVTDPNARRGTSPISPENYSYDSSTQILKINRDITDGEKYYATFRDSNGKFSDIRATIYTTVANAGVITQANNAAGLIFMLTPTGVVDEVDETLANYNLVNASKCTVSSDNYTESYSSGVRQAAGTGFTIDLGVSPDDGYTPIVGFGNPTCVLTPSNLGRETFRKFYNYVNAIEPIQGYRQISDCSALNSLGIYIMAVQADGTVRDISKFTGAGATILDSESVSLFYGTMIADCNTGEIAEGEYKLSDEGENLISDGIRDGHLKISVYVAVSEGGGSGSVTPQAVTPMEPKIDVAAKKNEITKALKENGVSLPEGVTATELDESNSTVKNREVVEVSDSDIAYFKSLSQDMAVILPIIEVSTDQIYVFNVSLDNLGVNDPIFWHSMVQEANGAFVRASAEDPSSTAIFYDNSGKIVEKVPSGRNVDVAVYLENGKTYAPVITTSSNGGGGGGGGDDDAPDLGSSSGCNSFSSIAAMILLSGMLISRKKY